MTMAIGKHDVAALERILEWAHDQAIGAMGRNSHPPDVDRQVHGTPPDESEVPDHGIDVKATVHGEEPTDEYNDHDTDSMPDDGEEPEHGELPVTHLAAHRIPAGRLMVKGKRK